MFVSIFKSAMANATPLRHLLASSAVFLALNAICENFPFLATGLTWIGVIIASIWIAWQLPKWLHFEEKVKPYNKAVLITGNHILIVLSMLIVMQIRMRHGLRQSIGARTGHTWLPSLRRMS